MDCRFYSEKRDCVASARYKVIDDREIRHIHYGVSCDRQTIYDNGGTYNPQSTVADSIRPNTAAVPRVELLPEGALRHDGTYTSKLELGNGELLNGACYVNEDRMRRDNDQDQGDDDQHGSGQDDDQDQDGHGSR